jgi:hypothetical protein
LPSGKLKHVNLRSALGAGRNFKTGAARGGDSLEVTKPPADRPSSKDGSVECCRRPREDSHVAGGPQGPAWRRREDGGRQKPQAKGQNTSGPERGRFYRNGASRSWPPEILNTTSRGQPLARDGTPRRARRAAVTPLKSPSRQPTDRLRRTARSNAAATRVKTATSPGASGDQRGVAATTAAAKIQTGTRNTGQGPKYPRTRPERGRFTRSRSYVPGREPLCRRARRGPRPRRDSRGVKIERNSLNRGPDGEPEGSEPGHRSGRAGDRAGHP